MSDTSLRDPLIARLPESGLSAEVRAWHQDVSELLRVLAAATA